MKRNVVCITGMHRSGTSMVARLLNLCGLYLGPEEEFVKPGFDNPEGFWENNRFMAINEALLVQFGGDWDYPPELSEGWETKPEIVRFNEMAEELAGSFHGHEPWGWKDPRNCLTFLFWKSLFPDMKVVICIRNPLDVAESLKRRNYNSGIFTLRLWLTYNQHLLAFTKSDQRIITHYESYFTNPESELNRVLSFLGLDASRETIERVCKTVSFSLRHHRSRMQDLKKAGVPPEIMKLYMQMSAEAGPVYQELKAKETGNSVSEERIVLPKTDKVKESPILYVEDEDLINALDENIPHKINRLLYRDLKSFMNSYISRIDDLLKSKEAHITTLREMLKSREEELKDKEINSRMKEEQARIQKEQEMKGLIESIDRLRREDEKRVQEITRLHNEVQYRDKRSNALYESWSWRVTAPLRIVHALIFRRNIVKNIARIIKTYDLKQAIPNIRTFGFRTFLKNAWSEFTKNSENAPANPSQMTHILQSRETEKRQGDQASPETDELKVWQEYPVYNERAVSNEWQVYLEMRKRIKSIDAARLAKLKLKPNKIISIRESEVSLQAEALRFKNVTEPIVSIIIPVYNNIEFTLECLLSIQRYTEGILYEIIVVDDGSTDHTQDIISNIKNITYLRNPKNLGFVHTCNKGAEKARGKYVLFLNNDVQVTKGWLEELVNTFKNFLDVGAVGPKIIYPYSRLQEAGAVVNQDCSTHLIGVTDDPELPRYNYVRAVDYCSGACLLIKTDIFHEIGAFDDDLSPSYCEDIDLCFRLRQRGLQILYNPKALIIHHLSVTSDSLDKTHKLQCVTTNQQKLSEKWQDQIDELNRVRLIAFYLPQFHPIPENDQWWGKGFTEWTNVAQAKPVFPGHYQPHLPADLGFYDLRVPRIREQQAELARQYGIHGFCYYYYNFNGKKLLDLPLNEMLKSGKPDFPFCLCWANENWTRRWDGRDDEVLISQDHSTEGDKKFIRDILPFLKDKRYIRVNNKLLLLIYRAEKLTQPQHTTNAWRKIVKKELGEELYLCSVNNFTKEIDPKTFGFVATVQFPLDFNPACKYESSAFEKAHQIENNKLKDYWFYNYDCIVKTILSTKNQGYKFFRGAFPSWDNTPRRNDSGVVFVNRSEEHTSELQSH